MTKNRFEIRKVGKLAAKESTWQRKLIVNFPAGTLNQRWTSNPRRQCTPIVIDENTAAVRAGKGVWLLSATCYRHLANYSTGELLRNAVGRAYKAHVRYEAKHVAWLDELGITGTPKQLRDLVATKAA